MLEAKLRLVHWPQVRSLLVLGYEDIFVAADQIPEILSHQPIAVEGIDDVLVSDIKKKKMHPENLQLLPDGNGWLLVEFGGESKEEADSKAKRLMDQLRTAKLAPAMKLYDDAKQEHTVWKIREAGLGPTVELRSEKPDVKGATDPAAPAKKP